MLLDVEKLRALELKGCFPFYICVDCDDILPWLVLKAIQLKVRHQLNPLNAWSQTIESQELTRPTSADFSTVPTERYPYFFPHTKVFNETDGYLYNDTMYLEVSFLTPQYLHLPSLLYFSLFRRGPQSFSTPCQWGWVVNLAITLNIASFKFRKWHNRNINSYLPLGGMVLGERKQSSNCTFWNFKISLTCPRPKATKPFYLLPAPVLGVWFCCFTNGTPYFLRVQFSTPLRGSPYLVLLGERPTALGHNLENYESSGKLSGRPPTVIIITLLIAYRHLRTQNPENTTENPTPSENFETSEIWKLSLKWQFSWILEYPSHSGTKPTIQRLSEDPFPCKGVSKRTINSTSICIEITRQTVSI